MLMFDWEVNLLIVALQHLFTSRISMCQQPQESGKGMHAVA